MEAQGKRQEAQWANMVGMTTSRHVDTARKEAIGAKAQRGQGLLPRQCLSP